MVVLDRPQGPVVIHAMAMRDAVSHAVTEGMVIMPLNQEPRCSEASADDGSVTDEALETMVDEAEQGYDVEAIRRRRGGRPPLGSAASSVESVRLDPELKRDLLLRAADEHISVSEAIRRAIGQYLRAG